MKLLCGFSQLTNLPRPEANTRARSSDPVEVVCRLDTRLKRLGQVWQAIRVRIRTTWQWIIGLALKKTSSRARDFDFGNAGESCGLHLARKWHKNKSFWTRSPTCTLYIQATICPRAYIRPSARVPAWRPDTSVSEPSVKHTSMMQ